jgi:hypothetical protein
MEKKHPLMASKPNRQKPHRKLIFLGGFANTGKDTVCQMLKEIAPVPIVRVSFADALKSEVYPTLGKEYDPENDDREWKDKHRPQIIQYGEGQKHEHGMFYWVRRALDELLLKKYERLADYPHIVVTDARRTEEFMWLRYFAAHKFAELEEAYHVYNPIGVAVHRPGAESDKDYLTHVALNYATETRAFSTGIKNEGDLKSLRQRVESLYGIHIK